MISANGFNIDADILPLVQVERRGIMNQSFTWRHDLGIVEPAFAKQLAQRQAIVHPQMMTKADQCKMQFPQETPVGRGGQQRFLHEEIRVPLAQISLSEQTQIREVEAYDPARPQNAFDFSQTGSCLLGVQMLKHMRAIDHIGCRIRQWDMADDIGELNPMGTDEGNEFTVISRQKRTRELPQSRNMCDADAEGVVIVLPSSGRQVPTTDIDSHLSFPLEPRLRNVTRLLERRNV